MSVKPNTIRLHSDIKTEYQKLTNVKELGVTKYSTEYILRKIAEKFYKSPRTIENIVFERTGLNYDNPQLSIFDQDSII